MTDKVELKSSHEVIYTVDVADVESIFYCKPTDPDILTVLMKDGKRLYCDEVCPIDSLQEEPVNKGRDIFDNCLKSEEKFILPQKISGNINCENCLYSSACALGDIKACVIDKPVNEELRETATQYGIDNFPSLCNGCKHVPIDAFKDGAQWQKEQDQSTIELAEDHAMLAGMEKMKEQMMKDAVEATVTDIRTYKHENEVDFTIMLDKGIIPYETEEELKLIIIKEN